MVTSDRLRAQLKNRLPGSTPVLPSSLGLITSLNLLGLLGWRRLCLEFGPDLPMQWGGAVMWVRSGPEAERLRAQVRSPAAPAVPATQAPLYATHLKDTARIAQQKLVKQNLANCRRWLPPQFPRPRLG
jgi:hypothetical protein